MAKNTDWSNFGKFFNDATEVVDLKTKKKENFGCGTAIFLLSVAILSVPFNILFYGFILMTLWNWFLPAIGIPVIGFGTAIGLNILLSFFKLGLASAKMEKEDVEKIAEPMRAFIMQIALYLIATWTLFIGWLVHILMMWS